MFRSTFGKNLATAVMLATTWLVGASQVVAGCERCAAAATVEQSCNCASCVANTQLGCRHCGCRCQPPFDRYKQSFVQLSESEASWIGPDSEFELTEVSTFLRLAIPLDGTPDNIIGLQPGMRTYFLNGPTVIDVPEKLYDAQLNILWRKKWSDRWESSVWMQPKIRSDFETTDDFFFFSGGAYAKYSWKPGIFDLFIGAFYLDRDDVSVLPAVGFVWTPTYDWRIEALLPRPKIAHRISRDPRREKWVYLSGQLGGGSFAVQRAAGGSDKVTIRDLRLFTGIETVRQGGAGLFAEIGYVFNRGVEYHDTDEVFDFDDAIMLRAGVRF